MNCSLRETATTYTAHGLFDLARYIILVDQSKWPRPVMATRTYVVHSFITSMPCTIIVPAREFEREILEGHVTSVTVIIKM